MTNTPGDGQTPQDPHGNPSDQPGRPGDASGEPQQGYWQQQSQNQPPAYGQAPPPGAYPPQGQVQYAPDHPKATTSLVLGILALVLCQVLGPFAWSMGKKTLNEIDASQGRVGGRGAAQAGYILGIVATVLLVLGLLMFVFVIGLAGLGVMSAGV